MVVGALMQLVAYGAQDIYLEDIRHNYNVSAYADNPYYRELANKGHRIHAAGGRHGNKLKDKADKTTWKKAKRDKQTNPSREPVNMDTFQAGPSTRNRTPIPHEQLAEELEYRLKQEATLRFKRELALANLRLAELKAKIPIRPLSENNPTCCISYEPIQPDSLYTQCQQCNVICSRSIMDIWLKNNQSCPMCRLAMSELDIDTITYRTCMP